LAEVLITLAIIGVIAAITIPSVVANHQKKELETRFAKSYKTLMHAVNMAIAEHGGIENWDWKDTYTKEEEGAFVKKYFAPYLNIMEFCPYDNSSTKCYPSDSTTARPEIMLADGTSLRFNFAKNCLTNKNARCLGFDIDTNGFRKPNKAGYDRLAFNFYPTTGEVVPYGVNKNAFNEETGEYEKYTYDELIGCETSSNPWNCTARIVMDGFKINY